VFKHYLVLGRYRMPGKLTTCIKMSEHVEKRS